jgi:hypothetical protein
MLATRKIGKSLLYVDTAERSNRMNGSGQQDTRYVVRVAGGGELASFTRFDEAERFMVAYRMSFGLLTKG